MLYLGVPASGPVNLLCKVYVFAICGMVLVVGRGGTGALASVGGGKGLHTSYFCFPVSKYFNWQ